jgi:hypothetical protein
LFQVLEENEIITDNIAKKTNVLNNYAASLQNKYYFIAMNGSLINLYFGIIIIMRKNFSAYHPMFQNKF